MTSPACPRSWQAEALQDGRLTGSDRLSFERHCVTCIACRHESAALSAMHKRLSFSAPPPLTSLERERMRASLLSRANAQLLSQGEATRRRIGITFALLTLAAVAGVIIVSHRRPAMSVRPTRESLPPRFEASGSPDAVWDRQTADASTIVTVAHGLLSIRIAPLKPNQRFVVRLPDGEADVGGATAISIDVRDHRSQRFAVLEGTATLRRIDEPELHLAAGDTWSAAAPVASTAPSATGTRHEAPALRHAPSANALELSPSLRAGPLFATAMASFESGDYAKAEADLQRFELTFPTDPRSEDATYLRAVALWRTGDRTQACTVARTYLERFPRGLRRPEAEELLWNDAGAP